MHVSGDLYEPDGLALVDIERKGESFLFSWKAEDSAGTPIAEDSRSVASVSMDDPRKPHAFLERYIRTHIQKAQLKRKNKMKVVEWVWVER